MTYLQPSQSAAISLFSQQRTDKVIMLNLLKFKTVADYSQHSESLTQFGPIKGRYISGKEAYSRYIELTKPILEQTGGKILLLADADDFFIGPSDEKWDQAMLIEQNSLQDFMSFANHPEYQEILAHRTAALSDSRLLPLWKISIA